MGFTTTDSFRKFITHDGNVMIPGSSSINSYLDNLDLWFEECDKFKLGLDLEPGYVASTAFLLLDETNVVDFFSIRHE